MPGLLTGNSVLSVFLICLLSCKKKDSDVKTVPTVTTGAVTDVTPSTATVSGEITDDGGTIVLAAGICYSATNASPTVADDTKVEVTDTEGEFSTVLEDLNSSTTYHVRVCAINSIGTGFGEVVNLFIYTIFFAGSSDRRFYIFFIFI